MNVIFITQKDSNYGLLSLTLVIHAITIMKTDDPLEPQLPNDDSSNNLSIVSSFIDTLLGELDAPSQEPHDQTFSFPSQQMSDSLDTDTLIDTAATQIIRTHTTQSDNHTMDSIEPQLRLDILLSENKDLLDDDDTGYESKEPSFSHQRSTFSTNAKTDSSNYNYYKNYFNRLSTNALHIENHPNSFNSTEFITNNPTKVHQIWSHTLRSKEPTPHTSKYSQNTEYQDSSNGIWDKLYYDAEVMRIKKEQLRQKHRQNIIDKEQQYLHMNKSQNHSTNDHHCTQYDDEDHTVFNKLYADHFMRQKKLQTQRQMMESQWTRNNSLQLCPNHQSLTYHRCEMTHHIPVENRLIQWNEYRKRKLKRSSDRIIRSQCTFKPELERIHMDQSSRTSCSSSPQKSGTKSVFNRLYDLHYAKKARQKKLVERARKEITFRPDIRASQKRVPAPSSITTV
eukprot:971433_1